MTITDVEYLSVIVRPITAQPFTVDRTVDERGVLLSLTVAKEDMGIVVGKAGETARAIRRLIRQFGMRNKSAIALRINEPII